MDDLLKDAIADAKAVRETALENAKIALEEAFTPRLQSMLSKKIQSEIEVDEGEHEDDREEEGSMRGEEGEERSEEGDDVEERAHEEDDDDVEERAHEEDDEDDVDEGIIEIDGVKYAPVVSEKEDDEDPEEGMHDDEDDVDEDLDLDEILKELEEEDVNEVDEIEEGEHEDDDDEKNEDLDENDVSSNIGSGDNKLDKKAGDSTDIGKAGSAKFESVKEGAHEDEDEDEVDEDIDLEEIVKALTEEDDEEEEKNEVSKLQSDLDEHRNVVKYLRSKLNEVNLLNAKLLFTNKLFRSFGLNNDQKMKVVETFDRAHNLREVKLVYSTLAESFGNNKKTEIKELKGSASKPVASTKSEKQEVISEGHELRDRFKKLAGIL
ncbi:MAG: hypothetical protein CBD26_00285 [Candidatus Pelagibacter sp. TMED166]|nr:MAG: hypothetical protein CBD26_00285 [Candidatus Pelagibacter sp. TMED166]|tara:strand:+ start:4168 stop:5304 length:1137 start_codon:yes stop_codon:yes gene_type:complete